MLTAKKILNIILDSPVHACQTAFLIFLLSESKIFISFIWLYDCFSPVPSKLLFSRTEIFTFQSVFNYFFLIICSAEDPISWASKGTSEDIDCMVYLGDYLPRKSHLVHKKLQTGELQKEMSNASTRHWVTEAASFSIKSYQGEHTCV